MSQLTELEYNVMAYAALAHYALDITRLDFIQYNGGITFRVQAAPAPTSFLLKIHTPVGNWVNASPAVVRARHSWLHALGQTNRIVVQRPIPNRQGELITLIADATGEAPYACTLQEWVEGKAFEGHLTPVQIRQIGMMMARFHQFSSEWGASTPVANDLSVYTGTDLAHHVQTLALAVELGFLSDADYALIQAAAPIIVDIVAHIGCEPPRWGPIHSDFHHGNLICHQDDIYLIDFDALSLGPYACDIGVMLYHIYYQGPALYAALLEGYETVRPLPVDAQQWLDAFVTQAAISNLAFNVTIPSEQEGPYLPRNLRQLVDDFCYNLVAGNHFLFPSSPEESSE